MGNRIEGRTGGGEAEESSLSFILNDFSIVTFLSQHLDSLKTLKKKLGEKRLP